MKYQARSIKGKLYDKARNNKLLHDVVTVTYPDLELLSETLRGAGLNGEIDLPTYGQFGSLVIEVAHNGLSLDTIRTFGQETQHLEHRWASQLLNSETGASEVIGKKVIFKGVPKKLGIGSIEPNKPEESSSAFEVLYMKYVIGNDVAFEIDKLNDVFKVGGVDYSANINKWL
jgi:P2 family phage contractile tail tube protein